MHRAADPPDLKAAKNQSEQAKLDVTSVEAIQFSVTIARLSHATCPPPAVTTS